MFASITAAVVDADSESRLEMTAFLAEHNVQVLAALPAVDQLASLLAGGDPQLVVVHLSPDPAQVLYQVAPLVRQYPNVNFFVLSESVDAGLLMEAIRVGVTEFIPLPVEEERFRQGLERLAQSVVPNKRATIINVIPTAGGCGATTVACNVAAALAKKGKTALVDLDLMRGTVAMSFDLRPRYTISDVLAAADKLDQQLLQNALVVHAPTGLAVLGRPDMPEDAHRVNRAGVTRLLKVLGQTFDYVVLDSQMSVDPLHMAAAQAADQNMLVMELSVPGVKNADRFMTALERMGMDRDRVRVVINRHTKRGSAVEPAEAERLLRTKIAWTIPNDFRNTMAAINFGEPVVLRTPRAEISASLGGLATSLNGKSH